MNIYVLKVDGEYGVAVVLAHDSIEARDILRKRLSDMTTGAIKVAKTIVMSRNPRAQILADYFE